MNQRLFYWSLTATLAGFLFDFDTVVISGAKKTIQLLWELGDFHHGLAMSMTLWGTVIGLQIGAWPTDHFGLKKTLHWIGILYFVSAICSALANEFYCFVVARFIGGLGIGISTVAAPLYIAKIAPPEYPVRLAGVFRFNIVLGILVAFVSNVLIGRMGENAWRWMLSIDGHRLSARVCFLLLLFDDGVATCLGENHCAGNKGASTGANRTKIWDGGMKWHPAFAHLQARNELPRRS